MGAQKQFSNAEKVFKSFIMLNTEKRFCRRVGTPRNFLLFMFATVGLLALLTTWMTDLLTETEDNQVTLRRRLMMMTPLWNHISPSHVGRQSKPNQDKKKPDQ